MVIRSARPICVGILSALSASVAVRAAGADEAAPPAAGTVGGALVGAEVVLVTEALIDLDPWWAYAVGGGLGAGAGAFVGYRLEQEATRDTSLYLLATGIALIVPTAVWVGQSRRPTPGERARSQRAPRVGLVRIDDEVRLGVPAPRVRLAPGASEMGAGGYSVTLPLLGGAF